MAIIPSNTQFIGDTTGIPIQELRSAQINALSGAFTMQDIIDTVSTGGGGGLAGTQYVYVAADGTDTANGAELQAAYATAKTMSPSISNRITVIAAPGNYNLSSALTIDTQYIDIVSLDGNRSVVFNGFSGFGIVFDVGISDVFLKGLDCTTNEIILADNLSLLRVENCSGSNGSFGENGVLVSGTFIDCEAGDYSFGHNGNAAGTFINCTGGVESFGYGLASGTFINCTAGDYAFGSYGTASGTFTNCVGGDMSFGSGGNADGIFRNCISNGQSFAAYGTASGTFTNCVGGYNSFGGLNLASGTFIDCTAFDDAFGGGGTASGTFTRCESTGNGCFGGFGTASGVFNNCIGGQESFGGIFGVLTGQAYYCRLITGTFVTVSGAGRTVLCIDGSNNQNNQ